MSNTAFMLSIPKPCLYSWDDMRINEKGRYCNSCNKTVIDFSILSDEEIKNYFSKNEREEICGRFKNKQLERIIIRLPNYFLKKRIPYWQKILIIFLICFGHSILTIEMGGYTSSSLYAQGTPRLSTKSKKTSAVKLKKKRSKYKIKLTNLDIAYTELLISGNVWRTEAPTNILEIAGKDSKSANINEAPLKPTICQTQEENKVPVPQKEERRHFEAILPMLLSKRSRVKNNSNKI